MLDTKTCWIYYISYRCWLNNTAEGTPIGCCRKRVTTCGTMETMELVI